MPRQRPRKTEKCKWTQEALLKAVKATDRGTSTQRAAMKYGIPMSTLRDRMKARNFKGARLGRYPVFNLNDEQALAKQMLIQSNIFKGLTMTEIRRFAFEFAETNGVPNKFKKESRLAGRDWAKSFLLRNPSIVLRSHGSVKQSGTVPKKKVRSKVESFSHNLLEIMKKYKFPENRIFNVDDAIHLPGKGVKERPPEFYRRVAKVTVVCAANAAGQFLPPMIVFPRKHLGANVQRDGPVGTIYQCSNHGSMTEELFFVWLNIFYRQVNPTVDDPVLLVLANHKTHISLNVSNYCKDNNIILLYFPLQPLHIKFVDSLRGAFIRECDLYLKTDPDKTITQYNFASIFHKAYLEATMDNVVSGFHQAGIFPVETEKFDAVDDFLIDEDEMKLEITLEESVKEEVATDSEPETPGKYSIKEETRTDNMCNSLTDKSPFSGLFSQDSPSLPNHSSISNQFDYFAIASNSSNEESCKKIQKDQEDESKRTVKKELIQTFDSECFSRVESCDELEGFVPFVGETDSYFSYASPKSSVRQPSPTQPPVLQPCTSSGQWTGPPEANLMFKYNDLFNNLRLEDQSINKDGLTKIINQLDAAFNSRIALNSASNSASWENLQTHNFNCDLNLDLFFSDILKIARTLSPLDQVIMQKDVANMAFEMKIRQLQG